MAVDLTADDEEACHADHVLGERVLAFCARPIPGVAADEHHEVGPGLPQGA